MRLEPDDKIKILKDDLAVGNIPLEKGKSYPVSVLSADTAERLVKSKRAELVKPAAK